MVPRMGLEGRQRRLIPCKMLGASMRGRALEACVGDVQYYQIRGDVVMASWTLRSPSF